MSAVSSFCSEAISTATSPESISGPSLAANRDLLNDDAALRFLDDSVPGVVPDNEGASARAVELVALPPVAPSSSTVAGANASVVDDGSQRALPTLDEAMRHHIGRALVLTRGRIEGRGGAADILGVNPHTLRGKMRRLKIEWSRYRI